MDFTLLEKLGAYCDNLLGEKSSCNSSLDKKVEKKSVKAKKSKKIKKTEANVIPVDSYDDKEKIKSLKCQSEENCDEWNKNIDAKTDTENVKYPCGAIKDSDEPPGKNNYTEDGFKIVSSISDDDSDISDAFESDETPDKNNYTEDGFKIVSSISDDDSDISDAFESDIDEEEWSSWNTSSEQKRLPTGKPRTTEDGFKIISEIPSDDSDISDAFTDEEDIGDTGEGLVAQRKELASKKSMNSHMAQMIDDFGLGEAFLKTDPATDGDTKSKEEKKRLVSGIRNSKKRKRKKKKGTLNTVTLAAKRNPQGDVTILDYSEKRDSVKLGDREVPKDDNASIHSIKEQLNQEMKKMRFEIYKLGSSGFEKKERKETREALAMKLGAKPRPNKYVNYKDLIAMKKEEKKKEIEKREVNKEMGIKNKKKINPKSKEDKKKPRAYTAQIGRFKDGVQHLSKDDLKKIMNS